MSILIIAEKPSVARSLCTVIGAKTTKKGYIEGNNYIVSWCVGHLVGLKYHNDYGNGWQDKWSFSQLPMIPDKWLFKVTESTKEQYDILKNLMSRNDVTEIICATDADREGECIFRYVYNMVKCGKPVKRLWVSSLEESAIRKALSSMKPMSDYDNLFAAGFSRAKADWLVGMNGSRLFSCRYKDKLNLGRVQTPTLAMIVQRDHEVKNFIRQKYFTCDLDCGDFKLSSARIDDENTTDSLVSACNCSSVTVLNLCIMDEYVDDQHTFEEKEVRFYEGATNPAVYTPAANWSTTEASGKQILNDVAAMISMLTKRGLAATEVLVAPDVADVILANEWILKLLDNRNYQIGGVNPEVLPSGVAKICRLNIKGRMIDFLSYDDTYTEIDGTVKSFIPQGMIAVGSPGAGRTIYGAVTQLEQADGEFHTYAGINVPKYLSDAKSNVRELILTSAPLCMPNNETVPLVGLLENMELSITKVGLDDGLRKLNKLTEEGARNANDSARKTRCFYSRA